MRFITHMALLFALYAAVSTLDHAMQQPDPITSWGEWADAGCSEDNRNEALCRAWEEQDDFSDSGVGCTDDCLD